MGHYFTPPTEEAVVAAGGRTLETDKTVCYLFEEDFQKFSGQLAEGEALLGLYIRPWQGFNNAVWLVDYDEMQQFEEQVRDGIILRIGFFAISKSVFH
jgi:hypothetical protein